MIFRQVDWMWAFNMHPRVPNFCAFHKKCFTLQSAVFELHANFVSSALNDPNWQWNVQGQKHPICIHVHPWGLSFNQFCSKVSDFESWANLRQGNWMIAEWPWHAWGQKAPYAYNTYTISAQIFILFTLRSALFEETEIFEFPIEYNVRIKFMITVVKFKIWKMQKKECYGDHH